jgi:predicted membrane protein
MSEERREGEGPKVVVGLSLSQKDRHSTLIAGLLIIAFGVLLLLDQEGIVPLSHVLRFWPLILIVPGLVKLLGGRTTEERVFGVVLVFFGLLFQFSALGFRHFEFSHIWPLIIIAAGAWILYSPPKVQVMSKPIVLFKGLAGNPSEGEINSVNVLGGGESRITSRNFRGGKLVAVFGGFKLDMSEAEMEGDEAVIDLVAFFGGGEFIIPRTWEVSVRGTGLFGGHGDETRHIPPEPGKPRKTLIIRGSWMFGGFNIKN